jgi:uncharacterized protein involved in response to NO
MTLAVMTRASLGHTGQRLSAGPLTQTIYGAVILAAFLRIAASLVSSAAIVLLDAAGAAWIFAFWSFAVGYGPLLSQPRKNAR